MKKKILFVLSNLKSGGVTTAFLNLINLIKDDKNLQIDVFMFDTDGASCLPPQVNVLPPKKLTRLLGISQATADKENKFLSIVRIILKGIAKLVVDNYVYSFVFMFEKTLKDYDVAISFSQSGRQHSLYGGMNEFVLTKVEADKKATVLHCDYENEELDTLYNCDLYQMFDRVCAASEGVEATFLSRVPECDGNTCVMHSCCDFYELERLSLVDTVDYDRRVLNILTVASLDKEKGHLRALNVLYRLKEDGFKFCWHVVGDGKVMSKLKKKIEEYNMTRNVILYGEQENPYKFFVNADIMLVPSYFEGASMVFLESEFFNLPIVATKTTSTDELVTDKNLGIVCENSENGLYKAFEYIFKNPHIIREIKNFKREIPNNDLALSEFYELIQGDDQK